MRVLYVDDEPDIRMVVEFALEDEADIELRICSSGKECMEVVESFDPDLILLDVMMPDMDGPTTLSRLREKPRYVETPVAFVTAKVQPREVEHFKALGASDVLAKPFDPMALPDLVRDIWRRAGHG